MKTTTFILASLLTLNLYSQTETDLEKDKIYSVLKIMDNWYTVGYVKYWNITNKWYIKGNKSDQIKKEYNIENYNDYVIERIKAVDTLGILTDNYYQTLLARLSKTGKFNEAMILTNHQYGDMVRSFLVERRYMDGIPSFWPEENIFAEENESLSDSDYIEWHKERITINTIDIATYKVFYEEVGDSHNDDYQLLKIVFLKEDGQWKIDNMFIEEQTKEDAIKFYDENVERRGYFKD